jgi:Ni/Fe-hydrogenase subunit HybB-like protein
VKSAHQPVPINQKFLTPGVWVLLVLTGLGICFGLYRFLFGLQASTNLNQQYPWGIWIVIDVSFIALAAGGFTTAALVHVFHREHYHAVARPALTAALLGYTFASVALFADLGRYYNIWHPLLPSMWQGNSALFEVAMCIMCYLMVLYIEFLPLVCERLISDGRRPRLVRACRLLQSGLAKSMCVFFVLGVAISCLHQSSLGHVMVLASAKLHPLWQTPLLSLMFLLSAIAAGFPVAIFVSICGSWALKGKPDMRALSSLAKYVPFFLGIYLAFKIGDMFARGSYVYLGETSIRTASFAVEMTCGLIVPLVMLLFRRVRRSPGGLCFASALVMGGVLLNRANVYLVGYQPPYADTVYVPSIAEWGLTVAVVAGLLLCWRLIAIYLPVMTVRPHARVA